MFHARPKIQYELDQYFVKKADGLRRPEAVGLKDELIATLLGELRRGKGNAN
jgi:hypothetical protein